MKKVLLLMMVIGIVVGTYAQNEPVKMDQKRTENQVDYQRTSNFLEIDMNKEATDVSRIDVGKAKSQRSFRREDTKTISYNAELDLISISFVLDKNTYDGVDVDGVVGMMYSSDRGMTWEGPVVVSDFDDDGLQNYYISAALFNPAGNTTVADAYGVYQGVPTDLNTWNNKGFGTSQLSGANFAQEFHTNSEVGLEHDGYFNQFGLVQTEDMMKCFSIVAEGPWANFIDLKLENIQGEYNGSGFDWELEESVIDIPFKIDAAGKAMWTGSFTFSDVAADVVWSTDGEIGYAWMIGVHEDDQTGYQPIMFKSTDGGDSWDEVEIDFQTDEAQDAMVYDATTGEGYLFPANNTAEEPLDYCIPWFNATAAAVDSDGNLQMFADLNGHYYGYDEAPTEDDYLSRFAYAGHMFKLTIGEDADGNDGLIDVMWVDSLRSTPATDLVDGTTNDDLYCGTNGWLRRLQISKNVASNEFFATWTDTKAGDGLVENLHPDVFGWSYNSELDVNSERVILTEGSLYETYYYYVQTAEIAMYDATTDMYIIPMVNAISLNDFNNNTSSSGDPVDVHYVTEMSFLNLNPVGINDVASANNSINVAQNQPNPFTGVTSIQVTSSITAPVMVEVTNIMGQTVYAMNAGTINGSKKVELNANDLESGIYFYTVTIGNESVTKKMIVE